MTEKSIQNCGKCGLCLNACPVYRVLKEEQASPRARLQLIKALEKKTLSSSPLLKEIMSKCLMCGSCAAVCPSGIDHYAKFMDMRKKMADDQGEAPAIKALIYLMAREYRLKLGSGLARKGQKLIPDRFEKSLKLGNIPLKNFPRLNPVPFRDSVGEQIRPQGSPTGKVAYFTGCATNYLYADTGAAVTGILEHLGYEVIIPKSQTCCSIPLLFHGAEDKARKNMAANIRTFADLDVDAILVDCSTCGEALKNEYPRLMEKKRDLFKETEKITSKVTDVLSFIEQHFDDLDFREITEKIPAAYHAPCHTRNSFNSHTAAVNMLTRLPGIDFKPSSDSNECCGGGGTFFYEYPEVSLKMVEKKIETVQKLGVTLWLTDCPVCRMNLAGNLDKDGFITVLHPATVIRRALK